MGNLCISLLEGNRFPSLLSVFKIRVSDPHWFNADPDPTFFLIADPDAVPDPGF